MFKKKHNKKEENNFGDFEMVLLKTTSDNYELTLIKSLLEENDIPYVLKDRGIGGYMRIITGSSFYGTDILVEKSTLEKVKSVLEFKE